MSKSKPDSPFRNHSRHFQANRYVYPVLSRRSRGLSVGVNLNLDKVCNFDCVYCQVDRTEQSEKEFIEVHRLREELDAVLRSILSGEIFEGPRFSRAAPELRRLNDIAFSGDGEPTTYRNFDEVVRVAAEVKGSLGLDDVKLVLITNASMFHRPRVQQALEIFDANNGEIWAKLDAGTEAYYRRIIRSSIPFSRILDNLLLAARARALVIQSLFMRVEGVGPDTEELDAYCRRLSEIGAAGGQIKAVQVHTVARPPAESWVSALPDAEVDKIANLVRSRTGLPVEAYYA